MIFYDFMMIIADCVEYLDTRCVCNWIAAQRDLVFLLFLCCSWAFWVGEKECRLDTN